MIHEEVVEQTLQTSVVQSGASVPENVEAYSQKAWDSKCIKLIKDNLMLCALNRRDKARLLATQAPHSGDWLFASPITAIGLRISNETIRAVFGTSTWNVTLSATHVSMWNICG